MRLINPSTFPRYVATMVRSYHRRKITLVAIEQGSNGSGNYDLSGLSLAESLAAESPRTPLILISLHNSTLERIQSDPRWHRLGNLPNVSLLSDPFGIEELFAAVRNIQYRVAQQTNFSRSR